MRLALKYSCLVSRPEKPYTQTSILMAVPVGFDSRPIQQWILEVSRRRVRELPGKESRVADRLDVAEDGCRGQVVKRFAKKRARKYALDDILPFRAQYHLAKFYAGRAV
jgi:hypothetical protein